MIRLMQQFIVLLGAAMVFGPLAAQGQTNIPTAEQQISAAVMAAPQPMGADAKVYGYNSEGEWTTLRQGNGDLVCIADNPEQSNFHVACYAVALEPFMSRGRELRRQGFTRKEVDKMRRQEIESGALELPRHPMTLYSLSGQSGAYDYEAGTLREAQSLTVIYVPFETKQSSGMATSPPAPGAPWLMDAGTPWAHIMIPGGTVGRDVEQ